MKIFANLTQRLRQTKSLDTISMKTWYRFESKFSHVSLYSIETFIPRQCSQNAPLSHPACPALPGSDNEKYIVNACIKNSTCNGYVFFGVFWWVQSFKGTRSRCTSNHTPESYPESYSRIIPHEGLSLFCNIPGFQNQKKITATSNSKRATPIYHYCPYCSCSSPSLLLLILLLLLFLSFSWCQVQELRKSRRSAAFLMLPSSKIEEATQNSFVFKLAGI